MTVSTETLKAAARPKATSQPRPARPADQDLWIFRDGKKTVSAQDLVADLRARLTNSTLSTAVIDALIEAGELEAALEDAGCESATTASRVTTAIASVVCGNSRDALARAADTLESLEVPARVSVSPPEGFTYYALHATDFVGVLDKVAREPKPCAVLGIRSIGTTLSAVVLAALVREGIPATRITVRPTGHPYSRRTEFSAVQLAWVERNLGAQFLIVDEGPGRSGSTFLSVAEALVEAGITRENITLIGSREPDVGSLCADNAPVRWRQFRFVATTPSVNQRFARHIYVGGGDWRKFLLPPDKSWPESWTQMERLKFVSPDWEHLYKFEGMGPVGVEARARAFQLADAGFGPRVCESEDGFLCYSLVKGKAMQSEDADGRVLDRIASYCAFRNSEFSSGSSGTPQLREMLEFNIMQEFGIALPLHEDDFCAHRPVISDGSMQPYEWIAAKSGQVIKVDGLDHGDNHFFPGPCDIAWDLAGASVEWNLSGAATEYMLNRFRVESGLDVSSKFDLYRLAYLVFRLGFCKMGISTVKGSPEETRLRKAYANYRAQAHTLLEGATVSGQAA
ncbi:MAG TPA: hypothetical protein VN708_18420 [Terriglobales bacterium]|nr:hypothetical protein [Terriglobales bacterium]